MKMNYRIMFFIASVLLMLPLSVMADNSLESAEKAYNEGKFAEAAAIYDKISQEHGVSASLLANMGNAYAKAGDYGQAFLCYERSLYLDPSSNEVRNNRAYILSKIEDGNKANAKGKNISVVADEPSFFSRVKRYVTYSHTSDTWAVWGAVSFVLLCGCIALYIFRTEVLLRKIGFFGGLSLLVLCVVFMTFSFASAKACQSHDRGVITGFKVVLLTEPFSSAKAVGTPLERGTPLDILESENSQDGTVEWYKVRLNSEFAGWIQASDFEVI